MATVTKSMALDESIHTTDGNDTNIADLMQSGLASIATAIGAIPALDAANITYDNSTSGLAATYVGTAIDELASEKADAYDVYTKAQTDAKIEALDYSDTAVSGSYVTEVDETDGVIAVTREAADATPTENSQKLVTSGGVYTALATKQDTLTAGTGIDITSNTISVDATASEITFDDTQAGLGASNTQDAIDALNDGLTTNTTLLGSTNISSIGDGTVTGGLSAINTDLTSKADASSVYRPQAFTVANSNGGQHTISHITPGALIIFTRNAAGMLTLSSNGVNLVELITLNGITNYSYSDNTVSLTFTTTYTVDFIVLSHLSIIVT